MYKITVVSCVANEINYIMIKLTAMNTSRLITYHLSISIYVSMYLHIYLSNYLPIYLSICLSIYI